MKILNYLNISNPSNLESDSGFIFQKLLMREILKLKPKWEFYFLCSKETPEIDHPNIIKIPINNNRDAYSCRFSFNFDHLKSQIKDLNSDLALINQSELSSSFKILFDNIFEKGIPIITYFHYLNVSPKENKNPEFYDLNYKKCGKIVFLRQIESAMISKANITCSAFAKDLFLRNFKKCVKGETGSVKSTGDR